MIKIVAAGVSVLLAIVANAVSMQTSRSIPAGQLSGTISDYVGDAPIVGAGVTILDGSRFTYVKSALSEPPNGIYEIDGLAARSDYWIVVCHPDYTTAIAFERVPAKANVRLNRRTASAQYWDRKVAGLVRGRAASQQDFMDTWLELEGTGISAEGKAYVARGLMAHGAKPEQWGSNLVEPGIRFRAYAGANPETLNAAEQSVWANGGANLSILDPVIVNDFRTAKLQSASVLKTSPSDPCSDSGPVKLPLR